MKHSLHSDIVRGCSAHRVPGGCFEGTADEIVLAVAQFKVLSLETSMKPR